MRGVFLNNDAALHTLCVEKDLNCYLRPFSTMIRLTRPSKPKKNFLLEYYHNILFFHKVVETPRIHPYAFSSFIDDL